MIEILRFALEDWGNLAVLILLICITSVFLISIVEKFKPIEIKHITYHNVIEEKPNEPTEGSY